jgi:hypothetical protein
LPQILPLIRAHLASAYPTKTPPEISMDTPLAAIMGEIERQALAIRVEDEFWLPDFGEAVIARWRVVGDILEQIT